MKLSICALLLIEKLFNMILLYEIIIIIYIFTLDKKLILEMILESISRLVGFVFNVSMKIHILLHTVIFMDNYMLKDE